MSSNARGWLELESDPGLFTLLVEDFGVKGVQVEEIYDLSSPVEGPVYGFIFLFKWIEERRSRRKMQPQDEAFVEDENIINNIFFAQQVIPNSCATLALLSVLMNCADKIHLGETLSALKKFSKGFSPEDKGYAIGNFPALAIAHNSHVRPEPRIIPEKQRTVSTGRAMEAFHFVSYMPINGRLFELDGLKPYPIDHGPWGEHEDWTKKFQRVISERLGLATGGSEAFHDIRYNLMAVVADRRPAYEYKLNTLKTNKQIILDALQKMVNMTQSHSTHPTTKPPSPIKSEGTPTSTPGVHDTNVSPSGRTMTSPGKTTERSTPPKANVVVPETDKLDTLASVSTLISNSDQCIPLPTNSSSSPRSKSCGDIVSTSSTSVTSTFSHNPTRSPVSATSSASSPKAPNDSSPIRKTSPMKVGSTQVDAKPMLDNGSPSARQDRNQPVHVSPNSKASPRSASPRVSSPRASSPRAMSPRASGHGHSSPGAISGMINTSPSNNLVQATQSYPHAFAPKDLLTLLRNVETEIQKCEHALKEEREKRLKYYIDHCRRVHNYDQFICTFLTMLAEQGLLAPLVEEHTSVKRCVVQRRGVPKSKSNGRRPAKRRRAR